MTKQDRSGELSESDWRRTLSPEQYAVLREGATEAPFSGHLNAVLDDGIYKCAGCGATLFTSDTKYDSGCGWPSFYAAIDKDAITERRDTSHGMIRTEISCRTCGGHLGHVFPDGPKPTGTRYCVNSLSLAFEPAQKNKER